MNRWQWQDTALVVAAAIALGVYVSATTARDLPRAATHIAFPLDSIPCGHFDDCTPKARARWMSHNPFWEANNE